MAQAARMERCRLPHIYPHKGMLRAGRSPENTPAAQGGNNARTIAICLHGLSEEKFTEKQLTSLKALCVQINASYGGKITFHGHREVAAKLCPVIDYKSILKLRDNGKLGLFEPATISLPMIGLAICRCWKRQRADVSLLPTIKIGASGDTVRLLQQRLKVLNYHSGKIDGHFGQMTRAAVLAFQADNHLIEDGVVGPSTYEALDDASPRSIGDARANQTVAGHTAERFAHRASQHGAGVYGHRTDAWRRCYAD
ncbi:MAG: peptidoglycan-binding domain-containing protein [Ahrensia sp.]|nr:peptidoglycan-binding domain-containing protein [Ahrensia sp.]